VPAGLGVCILLCRKFLQSQQALPSRPHRVTKLGLDLTGFANLASLCAALCCHSRPGQFTKHNHSLAAGTSDAWSAIHQAALLALPPFPAAVTPCVVLLGFALETLVVCVLKGCAYYTHRVDQAGCRWQAALSVKTAGC
jgi:hypothetical protein